MCVRKTEAVIGKVSRLGIHTLKCHAQVRPCGSFSERNILATQLNENFWHAVWKVWVGGRSVVLWGGGCERWVRWVGGANAVSWGERVRYGRLLVCAWAKYLAAPNNILS